MNLQTISTDDHDRSKLIGGSDIAVILGISPWRTRVDLWADKTTPRIEQSATMKPQLRRGIRWESVVAEMLVESLQANGHDVEIVRANCRYRDPEHSIFAAEIDYELRLDGSNDITNCELKTVHPFKISEWGESGGDDLPVHYLAQAMWGLGVTGRSNGMVAALFGADELRTYNVAADTATINGMRTMALQFWNDHVLAGVPPEPTKLADMQKLFPNETPDGPPLLADAEATRKVLRLRACKDAINACEAESDALEFELKLIMGTASELILANGKSPIEWKTRSGHFLDETALKTLHPKISKEFQREWKKRVFRCKPFDVKGLQP